MRSIKARTWFHLGAWAGLSATVYTNYRAAPVSDLQVAYLVVPVLMAALSEGLIRTWEGLDARVRTLLTALLFALVATSYEHLRSLTLDAHGTPFAANVGSAVIDGAIFGCVLATATLTHSAPLRSAPTLVVAPVSAPPAEQSDPVDSAPEPTPLSAPVAPLAELDSAPVSAPPLRSADRSGERALMAERFGQNDPTHTEVRALFACGDSKAARILREYRESQE